MIPRWDASSSCQPHAQFGLVPNKDHPTVDEPIPDQTYEADISTPRLEELPP